MMMRVGTPAGRCPVLQGDLQLPSPNAGTYWRGWRKDNGRVSGQWSVASGQRGDVDCRFRGNDGEGGLDCGLRGNDGEAGMVVGAGPHPLAPSPTFGEGVERPDRGAKRGPGLRLTRA